MARCFRSAGTILRNLGWSLLRNYFSATSVSSAADIDWRRSEDRQMSWSVCESVRKTSPPSWTRACWPRSESTRATLRRAHDAFWIGRCESWSDQSSTVSSGERSPARCRPKLPSPRVLRGSSEASSRQVPSSITRSQAISLCMTIRPRLALRVTSEAAAIQPRTWFRRRSREPRCEESASMRPTS